MTEERERFYSRLATLPGVRPMPSVGCWILIHVADPPELARRINRRTVPGLASVPRNIGGALRLPVRSPKDNEDLFQVVRELTLVKTSHLELFDEEEPAADAV